MIAAQTAATVIFTVAIAITATTIYLTTKALISAAKDIIHEYRETR